MLPSDLQKLSKQELAFISASVGIVTDEAIEKEKQAQREQERMNAKMR